MTIVLLVIWVCGAEPVLGYTQFRQSYELHENVLSLWMKYLGEKVTCSGGRRSTVGSQDRSYSGSGNRGHSVEDRLLQTKQNTSKFINK